MTQHIRLKPSTLPEIKDHTQKDNSLVELIKVIEAGWPETKGELSHLVLPFFDVRDELSVCDGIVIRGERVVVPKSQRRDMLYRLHYAHSGVIFSRLAQNVAKLEDDSVTESEVEVLRRKVKELGLSFENEAIRRKGAESTAEAKRFPVRDLSKEEKVFKC
ncbi:hypothetical protein AWC38_SpisGene4580 [Stylophora pistillata]|uniref:Uncharacterized protein n=1 Tax=Stylophora pistillata TaxID=50429 RepID=A0A2B4SNG9_STYPI|nr:hypothetical protein AWC38_SpisGene4580 [Stylophora pistillata]